ncbi:DUF368 domain-containing protein [Carnobacterium jeotgali]|uniref:DUF368 domain-containing protein n=1 Tax=Carnobacterium jeotgali TaxID=545534 RepID=UPI003C71424A
MKKNEGIIDWFIRFVKGMFIGSGAILPGVSGGALAAVFGIYENMIAFLSNIRKDFLKNVNYFIPVGIGGLFGIFVLAYPIDYFLKNNEVQVLWSFIGCILGTLPALYKEAGKNGRKPYHLVITVVVAILAFIGLLYAKFNMNVIVEQSTLSWVMAGGIFALGFIVPGLSPSNFLMYMHLYEPMTEGIKDLNFSILIPVAIGAILCVLLLSKLVSKLMEIAYTSIFHFILGVVIASTVIIAPMPEQYNGMTAGEIAVTVVLFFVGLSVGLLMEKLESNYKPAEINR